MEITVFQPLYYSSLTSTSLPVHDSPAPSHFLSPKKEQKQKEVENPLCFKKERAREDSVGETNISNKGEKERGKDVRGRGGWKEWDGNNRDTLGWWLIAVEMNIHLGASFCIWHHEQWWLSRISLPIFFSTLCVLMHMFHQGGFGDAVGSVV